LFAVEVLAAEVLKRETMVAPSTAKINMTMTT
jgi:hypothetical protein